MKTTGFLKTVALSAVPPGTMITILFITPKKKMAC